jgi:hypothetical protein
MEFPSDLAALFSLKRAMKRLHAHVTGGGTAANVGERAAVGTPSQFAALR